jgi:transposase-like protein
MDATNNAIICGRYPVNENSEKQVRNFFNNLKSQGLNPVSCTVDGNPQVITALRKLWPGIIIQRCLIHIQRQGFMWCRANPKTAYGRELRKIFVLVTCIRTKEEQDHFLEQLAKWEEEYGKYIASRKERGRVFSDIKRARSMLLKALPDMFHYLDDSNTSFTTNSLEGYFSRLKRHYGQHRGLPKKKLANYLAWYIYFHLK